jgi:hypothetical protein
VGDVALSINPSDSSMHYGFRVDSTNNNLNLDNVDASTNLLSVTSGGDVTITTTTNEGGLSITSATDNTTLRLGSQQTGGKEWRLYSTGGTSGFGQGKLVIRNNNDSINALTILATGIAIFSNSITSTRFTSSTNVFGFFNNSTGTFAWEIGSDSSVGTGMYMYNPSGGYALTLTAAGTLSTLGGGTSDRRLKEKIEYINSGGIESIKKLKPVKFEFKKSERSPELKRKQRRGFIAQDVLEVIPDLVLGDGEKEDGVYGLDYDGVLALSVKAIQEQQTIIDTLTARLDVLEKKA